MKQIITFIFITILAMPLTASAQLGGFLKGLEDLAKGLDQFSKTFI